MDKRVDELVEWVAKQLYFQGEHFDDGTHDKSEPARDIPALFASIGIVLDPPAMFSYSGSWHREGKGTLDSGHEVNVDYFLKGNPSNCELIEVRTRPLVIRYKSKCEETEVR